MTFSWLVMLPPLLVLLAALYTRNMILSFFIGIVSGALIATKGAMVPTVTLIIKRFTESSGANNLYSFSAFWNNWNLCILLFLLLLGILVVLLQYSGSTHAFVRIAQKKVHNRKTTEITSLLLSLIFFIDDYFSALTVGSIMRPLAAKYRVHPIKMAFLVTAMASPITILFPISSWVGEVILQLKQAGIGLGNDAIFIADPFYLFVRSIPYILYAILLIIGTWYIVLRGISYGPLKKYEDEYQKTAHTAKNISEDKNSLLIDFIVPIGLLIGTVFIMLLFTGNYSLFGGNNLLIEALKNGSVHQALLVSGLISTLVGFVYFLLRQKITLSSIKTILHEGIWLMLPSIIMLINAWTLSIILKQDLQTGAYIATLFSGAINSVMFPATCFIISALIAFMAGSAWATIGLMYPIVIPMLAMLAQLPHGTAGEAVLLLLPVIGATLSGSIMGTHVSLISDNPIMAAASCSAPHLALVKCMSWYIVPVGIATAAAYTMLSLSLASYSALFSVLGALAGGMVIMILLFEAGQWLFSAK